VWLTTNTINCENTDDYDLASITEGDEVVITDGYGRGFSTFIESIEVSSNTYSFTLKDSLGTINEDVTFYTTPMRHVFTFTNDRNDEIYTQNNMDNVKSPWIMIGSELRGFQTEVSHLELPNIVHKNTQ
jgi:hypothetical protein